MSEFAIVGEISTETVNPVVEALVNAFDGEIIKILLPYNSGGSVDTAIGLVDAIKESKADVIIELDRYIISAAAFIWIWFFLRPETNVKVTTTGEPAIIVYHRPRVSKGDHLVFLDDLPIRHKLRKVLEGCTSVFDELFEELIATLGYLRDNENIYIHDSAESKHKFKHIRDGYYFNQDCVIPT